MIALIENEGALIEILLKNYFLYCFIKDGANADQRILFIGWNSGNSLDSSMLVKNDD